MSIMTFTVAVDRDASTEADWRDDPRWDQLYERAVELFPDNDVVASGELRTGIDQDPEETA